MRFAIEKGIKNIDIITIEPHISRAWEMEKRSIIENDYIGFFERINFIDSWAILKKKDRGEKHFAYLFNRLENLSVYRKTKYLEEMGMNNLRSNV